MNSSIINLTLRCWIFGNAFGLLLLTGIAQAGTVTSVLDDGDPGTLRETIAAAAPGDTIDFAAALDGQTITLTFGDLFIDKDLTIQGLGAARLAVNGDNLGRVFLIASGQTVTIAGLTVTNGNANGPVAGDVGLGGGIFNAGTLTLSNCVITGNTAVQGGGICNRTGGNLTLADTSVGGMWGVVSNTATFGGGLYNEGTLTLNHCTVSGNAARQGAGIFNRDVGVATLFNSSISSNSAAFTGTDAFGGGIFAEGPLTLVECVISGNRAFAGGGFYCRNQTNSLNRCTVSENTAASHSAGIHCDGALNVTNSTISRNRAIGYYGGGISIRGPANIIGCLISDNRSADSCGGIHSSGSLLVKDTTIRNCVCDTGVGGGIAAFGGTATILDCTLSSNRADLIGGGIFSQVPLFVENTTIRDCVSVTNSGGGIYCNADLTLTRSILSGNEAANAYGGGLWADAGAVTITGCTISSNRAGFNGGGIYSRFSLLSLALQDTTVSGNVAGINGGGIRNFSQMTLLGSTFSGNAAGDQGGAIANGGAQIGGTMALTNCTFSGNRAVAGGAIWNGGTTSMKNTLLANSPSGGNIVNTANFISLDFNLSDDASSVDVLNGFDDQNNVAALLGPLQDHGGLTWTHALLAGSPAMDAGDAFFDTSDLPFDQRGPGYPRVVRGRIDIGAIEHGVMRLTCLGPDAQGLHLLLRGEPRETVRIEWNEHPAPTGWQSLLIGTTDDAGRFEYTAPIPSGAGRRFYRGVSP